MTRFTAALLAAVTILSAPAGACLGADLAPGPYPGPARFDRSGPAGAPVPPRGGDGRARVEYSYYGEYGYPAPFGYGFAYAPVRSRGFEYGYYGPRYVWSAPDWYYGPAFGHHAW
jgi:hypothetical protein